MGNGSRTVTSVPGAGDRTGAGGWHYVDTGGTRDLRIDFMRGFVFVMLFTAHFSYFSLFALVGWERFGVVSSAETFIILAGVVTGAVYGKTMKTKGLSFAATKLFARAWTLYKIAFIVAASIALLRLVPGLDTEALTTFTDPVSRETYPLYPPPDRGFMYNLLHLVFLKAGPHQFQVIGLYVVLFLLTPGIFWAISRGKAGTLLLISWGAWLLNFFVVEAQEGTAEVRITGAQFEFAFPLLAWQLIFVHGVVAGYYRRAISAWFDTAPGRVVAVLCFALSVAFALFSLNHPLPELPEWARLSWIPPETFLRVYNDFFLKYNLGPGRLLNNAVLLVTVYGLLTVAWKPIEKALGWLFVPLGQESMYVFFMHVYLILLVSNTGIPQRGDVWLNTFVHAAMLVLCWLMVKTRFLFRWVPR